MPSIDDAVFVEPPDDRIINLDNFETTLLHQPIRRLAKHPWIQTWQDRGSILPPSKNYNRQELRLESRDSQLDGLLRTELKRNHEDAQNARKLLLGDDITAAWTTVLRALTHVHKWHISTILKEPYNCRWPLGLMLVVAHPVRGHGRRYQCHTYDEDLGDAVFAAATRSLSEANVRPHELVAGHVTTGHFGWETLPGWQRLDLSHLQSFCFQPVASFYNENQGELEWEESISPRAANAIAAVLRKCSKSLQELTCKGDCPLQWPGSEIISLPALRSLIFERVYIRPRNLGKWMARMPQLQYLWIFSGGICEDDHSDFRSVFDAVRNQSKGMRVRLNMFTWYKANFDLDFHTHAVEHFLEEEQERDSENVNRDLALYLSGKVEWNPSWLEPG